MFVFLIHENIRFQVLVFFIRDNCSNWMSQIYDLLSDGQVIPLVELSAKQVAFHIPFEVVEKVYPPVPEQLQLRIAYWSFPENEEDIR